MLVKLKVVILIKGKHRTEAWVSASSKFTCTHAFVPSDDPTDSLENLTELIETSLTLEDEMEQQWEDELEDLDLS